MRTPIIVAGSSRDPAEMADLLMVERVTFRGRIYLACGCYRVRRTISDAGVRYRRQTGNRLVPTTPGQGRPE